MCEQTECATSSKCKHKKCIHKVGKFNSLVWSLAKELVTQRHPGLELTKFRKAESVLSE